MACVMKLEGVEGAIGAQYREHNGRYLRDYDPDAYRGRGRIRTTENPGQAIKFADASHAMECWRRQSSAYPLREDGQPNRPLTAYTVSIVDQPG